MIDSKKFRLVMIKWEDSVQPTSSWDYLSDAPPLEVVLCLSVGWIIDQNEKVLMIAPNIGDCDSEKNIQGSGFIRIQKVAITKIIELCENKEILASDKGFEPLL